MNELNYLEIGDIITIDDIDAENMPYALTCTKEAL